MRGSSALNGSQNNQPAKTQPQQEAELVEYLKSLTKRGLPPTREITRNFASQIAKEPLGEKWVARFLKRNDAHLIHRWTPGMDALRHRADSEAKYNLYFDLLHQKIIEYKVEPRHTDNMDEKDFMIGVIGRSKRIFSRRM
jgi:hypothetical protein